MANLSHRIKRLESAIGTKEEVSNLMPEERTRLDELEQIWEYRELTEAEFKEKAMIMHKMIAGRNVAKKAVGLADMMHDARIRVEARNLRLKNEQEELN